MSLSNSLRSTGSHPMTLVALSSIPTTEDLRYLMATAKKAMKPVSLPFKKDPEGPNFIINFTQPNRWTFTRIDDSGSTQVWVKESIDVLMIQNKVKIDSCVVQGHYEQIPYQQEQDSQYSEDPYLVAEQPDNQAVLTNANPNLMTIPDVAFSSFLPEEEKPTALGSQDFEYLSQGIPEQSFLPASSLPTKSAVPPRDGSEVPYGQTPQASKEVVAASEDELRQASFLGNWAQGFSFAGPSAPSAQPASNAQLNPPVQPAASNAQPNPPVQPAASNAQPNPPVQSTAMAGPANQAVPTFADANQAEPLGGRQKEELTPFPLDPYACDDIKEQLSDASTRQISFSAFTYFLVRESIRASMVGATLSVVVFDFRSKQTGQVLDLSAQTLDLVALHLDRLCSVLHIPARMDSGEFAVLLCDANQDGAIAFAEALRASISSDENLGALYQGLGSFSIGFATVSETIKEPAMLLAAAKKAKTSARAQSLPYQAYQ